MFRTLMTVCGLLAVLLLASCGGSSGSPRDRESSIPTSSDFVHRANAVCKSVKDKYVNARTEGLEEAANATLASHVAKLKGLGALTPPRDLQGAYKHYLVLLHEQQAALAHSVGLIREHQTPTSSTASDVTGAERQHEIIQFLRRARLSQC